MHRPMLSFMFAIALGVAALAALAQEGSPAAAGVDQELLAQGQELFRDNCTICHQSSGQGNPPAFPALAGNENLQDLTLIVTNIHDGRNAMPAFPQFDATQIAALATYIRNTWDNAFGGVDVGEVEAILAQGADEEAATVSIWDGVYTMAQAERGEPSYTRCAQCHGVRRLGDALPASFFRAEDAAQGPVYMHVTNPGEYDIGPPIAGDLFLRNWDGRSVGQLFLVSSTTMPQDQPGALPEQEYIDIIAFLLAASGAPAGDEDLPADVEVLNNIVIEQQPED